MAGARLRDLALPEGVGVCLIVRGRDVVMPRGTAVLMPLDLRLSFHAATSVEQLLGFYRLPLPLELAEPAAAASLRSLLESNTTAGGLSMGALQITAGADLEHISVSCSERPTTCLQ